VPLLHLRVAGVIDGHREAQLLRVIVNHVRGPRGDVLAGHNPVEVDKREAPHHALAQARVVRMPGIGPPVPVAEQPVVAKRVVVGTPGGGRDGEGELQDTGLENALRTHEGDTSAVDLESSLEQAPRQHVAVAPHGVGEPLERGHPDADVPVLLGHGDGSAAPGLPESLLPLRPLHAAARGTLLHHSPEGARLASRTPRGGHALRHPWGGARSGAARRGRRPGPCRTGRSACRKRNPAPVIFPDDPVPDAGAPPSHALPTERDLGSPQTKSPWVTIPGRNPRRVRAASPAEVTAVRVASPRGSPAR
jgi:hypothetical protein